MRTFIVTLEMNVNAKTAEEAQTLAVDALIAEPAITTVRSLKTEECRR